MSAANDLIFRLEKETGHRIDEKGSPAMAGLLGAMSRKMGLSPDTYQECDDVAAGIGSRDWQQGLAAGIGSRDCHQATTR